MTADTEKTSSLLRKEGALKGQEQMVMFSVLSPGEWCIIPGDPRGPFRKAKRLILYLKIRWAAVTADGVGVAMPIDEPDSLVYRVKSPKVEKKRSNKGNGKAAKARPRRGGRQ